MGKRKKSSRGPQGPKKREPLATTFKCVFCNSENSVSTKSTRRRVSQASLARTASPTIRCLRHPVDVYFDWIDACEAVAQAGTATGTATSRPSQGRGLTQSRARGGLAPGEKVTEEDDGFIDDEGAEVDDFGDED
ncbi:Transcription elongation factor 1 [Oleoguttula sp. CCFEE 5521]